MKKNKIQIACNIADRDATIKSNYCALAYRCYIDNLAYIQKIIHTVYILMELTALVLIVPIWWNGKMTMLMLMQFDYNCICRFFSAKKTFPAGHKSPRKFEKHTLYKSSLHLVGRLTLCILDHRRHPKNNVIKD